MSTRLVERSAKVLERRISRRGFLRRAAIVGSALAAAPTTYVLRKGSAYAAITKTCSDCPSGSKCCDGWTEFCCTLHGVNTCPPGTMIAGWWRANYPGGGPDHCEGAPRYYMDCNSARCSCGCGASGTCSHTCAQCTCGCANDSCSNRRACCNRFRYGQCNNDAPCLGPIECRVVTCVPPWEWDSSCTKTDARSQSTWYHDAACLRPSPDYPARPAVVTGVLSALGAFGRVDWVWGSDRYATAAKVSADAFSSAVSTVYVASGANFPDALAGAAAAARAGGPVLLVRKDSVPSVTADELRRLSPSRIVVTGGPSVVSESVVSALGAFGRVDWVWGSDRYATAAKVSADAFSSAVSTVYVASGANFPDALAGAAAAARAGGPVLLVRKDSVPSVTADELRRLSPSRIVVTGGPSVYSGRTWKLRNSLSSGDADSSFALGSSGDVPLMGDWTGAGVATACNVRPVESGALRWHIRNIEGPGDPDNVFDFGRAGDVPVAGDWNGNGVTTPGVVRGNQWLLRNRNSSGGSDLSFTFGEAGDTPVVGKWDGGDRDLPGVVRGSRWLLKTSPGGGTPDIVFEFGSASARPVVGDWRDDGRDLPGRFENGRWELRYSLSGGSPDRTFTFGDAHDAPLVWGRVT